MERLEEVVFRETTTLGIRRWPAYRHTLERQLCRVSTVLGDIQGKISLNTDRQECFSPEFESAQALARKHDLPLKQVYQAAYSAFAEGQVIHRDT